MAALILSLLWLQVYKARLDGVLQIAVKAIKLGNDPVVQSNFLREAGLLWKLR